MDLDFVLSLLTTTLPAKSKLINRDRVLNLSKAYFTKPHLFDGL